jgi:hypothetical protein
LPKIFSVKLFKDEISVDNPLSIMPLIARWSNIFFVVLIFCGDGQILKFCFYGKQFGVNFIHNNIFNTTFKSSLNFFRSINLNVLLSCIRFCSEPLFQTGIQLVSWLLQFAFVKDSAQTHTVFVKDFYNLRQPINDVIALSFLQLAQEYRMIYFLVDHSV